MLDQEFLVQVQEILTACTHANLQKAVFSATLPAGAERIALDMLRDPIRVVVGLKFALFLLLWYLQTFLPYRFQRHPSAPHSTNTHLRGRRPLKASHIARIPLTTIQASGPYIYLIATSRDLPCRRACLEWYSQCRLSSRRNDKEGAR
jgi:hypothetical protein